MATRLGGICLLIALTAVIGCGDGRIARAKVIGKVTYKGAPVSNASISFLPETPGVQTGMGKTDKEGNFFLGTFDHDDGAPVGWCKVAVSLRGPPKKLPPNLGEAFKDQLMDSGDPLIPLKYFDPEKSGLRFEIVAGKTNEFNIDLQ